VYVFREGDRANEHVVTFKVRNECRQQSWSTFVDLVKDCLLLTAIEGVYTSCEKMLPVMDVKSLIEGHSYMVRPTEGCALVRSLTLDKTGRYPASEVVERCRRAHLETNQVVDQFSTTMGHSQSYAEWHVEFSARERAQAERQKAEAQAQAEEERRVAALDPYVVGAEVEVTQGYYKGKTGLISQRQDEKAMINFHDGTSTLSWMKVDKLFKVPEPERPPTPDPDSLIQGPRNEDQVIAYVTAAEGAPLALLDMFEPLSNGDATMHPRICFRSLQQLALSANIDELNKDDMTTLLRRLPNTMFPFVDSSSSHLQVVMLFCRFVDRLAKYDNLAKRRVAKRGALDLLILIAKRHQDDVRVQQCVFGSIFKCMLDFPPNRPVVMEKTLGQLVIPICSQHSEIHELLAYALWILMEICQDPASLEKMRQNQDLVTLVQCINTRTFTNEHIRQVSANIIEKLTGVHLSQGAITRLPPVKLRQEFGDFGDAVVRGRDLGSAS